MPKYGINDKDPERIAEEQAEAQFLKDSAAALKRAELQEIEDRHRRAIAEQEKLESKKIQSKELKELRQNLEGYVTKYTANKKADKAADRKFQTKQTILNAVICAIVGFLLGLASGHLSEIISFIANLFQ